MSLSSLAQSPINLRTSLIGYYNHHQTCLLFTFIYMRIVQFWLAKTQYLMPIPHDRSLFCKAIPHKSMNTRQVGPLTAGLELPFSFAAWYCLHLAFCAALHSWLEPLRFASIRISKQPEDITCHAVSSSALNTFRYWKIRRLLWAVCDDVQNLNCS